MTHFQTGHDENLFRSFMDFNENNELSALKVLYMIICYISTL